MAKKCEVCGKSPSTGNIVAKSKVTTRRVWRPNIQKIRVVNEEGVVQRKYVCTKCLKSGRVQKA